MILYAERDKDGKIIGLHDGGANGRNGVSLELVVYPVDSEDKEVKDFIDYSIRNLPLTSKIRNLKIENPLLIHSLVSAIISINNKEAIPDWALQILSETNLKINEVVELDAQQKSIGTVPINETKT